MRGSGYVFALSLLVALCGAATQAETFLDVASPAALSAALKDPAPGTVIRLAGGTYGALVVQGVGGALAAPVTLTPADPAKPVTFTRMALTGAHDLVLDGLTFDYTYATGDTLDTRPFHMANGHSIIVRHCLFDGDLSRGGAPQDEGYPTGNGLLLRGMTGISIEDSEIRGFYRGLMMLNSTAVVIRNNDIHDIRMDGTNFAQMDGLLIEGNKIHDFTRVMDSPDHSDMIQFWTTNTTEPSRNITIRNNILNSGTGWFTQSIFMRNELVDQRKAGPEMFYRNVTIEDNIILNAHLHGITVGETAGLVIAHNSVLRNASSAGSDPNPGLWTPRIRVAPTSTDVVIGHNITAGIDGYTHQPGWSVTGNVLVQDTSPTKPGYYDQVFVAARGGDPDDVARFTYRIGGALAGAGVGAPQLDPANAAALGPPRPRAVIRIVTDPDQPHRFTFDASPSTLPAGITPDQARYAWAVGAEAPLSGAMVQQDLAQPGAHKITLTVTLPDGKTLTAAAEVSVDQPEVLAFSATTGSFTGRGGVKLANIALPKGVALTLGQDTPPIVLRPEVMAGFFGAHDFDLRLRLRGLPSYKAAGEVLRIHQNLVLSVTGRGTLEVQFTPQNGKMITVRTTPVQIFSGGWHDVDLHYSASTGAFAVGVDGRIVGQGQSAGPTRPLEHWGLSLGNPFGQAKSFDGALESLSLRVNLGDAADPG